MIESEIPAAGQALANALFVQPGATATCNSDDLEQLARMIDASFESGAPLDVDVFRAGLPDALKTLPLAQIGLAISVIDRVRNPPVEVPPIGDPVLP